MKLEDAAQFESQRQVSITKSQAQSLSRPHTHTKTSQDPKLNTLWHMSLHVQRKGQEKAKQSKLKALRDNELKGN